MKKVLSVFLAVLMLFGALSVSSFAEETTAPVVTPPMAYHDWWGEGGPCSKEQAVLAFNLNGGSLKSETQIYNEETGTFEWKAGKDVTGVYYMVPQDPNTMKGGMGVVLPEVIAPSGQQFNGWYCEACPCETAQVGQTYAAAAVYKLPANCGGYLIQFRASYSPATIEEPTINKVVGILIKVFGAIIGLIVYQDTKQGIAFMERVLGDLFD